MRLAQQRICFIGWQAALSTFASTFAFIHSLTGSFLLFDSYYHDIENEIGHIFSGKKLSPLAEQLGKIRSERNAN